MTAEPPATTNERRKHLGRNLTAAIVTGLLLAGFFTFSAYRSPLSLLGLVGGAALLAQAEFYAAVRAAGYDVARAIGLVIGAIVLLGAHHQGLTGVAFGLAIAVPATALWIAADPDRTHQMARGLGMTVFGILWLPFLASHLLLLHKVPGGPGLVFIVIALPVLYDVAAYAVGYRFGKTRLAPTVSPKKSLEGAIGATLFIMAVAAFIGPLFVDLSRGWLLVLAAATGVAAPLGDLAESLVKRDLGIKDMGRLLPGHGGVLDRFDAVVVTIPVGYWIVRGAIG